MTVLVTGATGFIGARLVRALGERAVALSRRPAPGGRLDGWHGRWATVDPVDAGALAAAVERFEADVVVHTAVARGPDHSAEIEAERCLVRAVCRAMDRSGAARLVALGSAAEYGVQPPPLHEGMEPRPTTAHGRAKAAGTREVLAWAERADASVTVLRPFHVTGPGEPVQKLVPRALAAATGGLALPLVPGTSVRDVVGVDDVVLGILAAIDRPPVDLRPVNLCSGVATSVRDVVATVEQVTGRAVPTAGVHARTELDEERRVGDPSRAAALWGWRARPLAETIAAAAAAWPWEG